jgi:hypothetical protein
MAKDPFFGSVPRAAKRRSFSLIRETGKNRGLKREAELILLYYVPREPLSRWIPPWAPKQKQSSLAPGFSWSPKTTIFNILTGLTKADRGQVFFQGTNRRILKPSTRVLAQQRYAKSHRILANCRGVKGENSRKGNSRTLDTASPSRKREENSYRV